MGQRGIGRAKLRWYDSHGPIGKDGYEGKTGSVTPLGVSGVDPSQEIGFWPPPRAGVPGYSVLAPLLNQRPISARSASVMPVALFIGMIRLTTTC